MFARRIRPGTAGSSNAGLHIGSSAPTGPVCRVANVLPGRTVTCVTSSPAQAGAPAVSTIAPASIAARIPVVIVVLPSRKVIDDHARDARYDGNMSNVHKGP